MKKRFLVLTMLLVATLAVAAAYAGGPRHGRHGARMGMGEAGLHGIFGRLGALREELGLTDQQVEQIRTIAREVRAANAGVRDDMHEGFGEVASILIADPDDLEKARVAMAEREAAMAKLKENVLQGTSRALKVLTPEQRVKLGEIVAEHKSRR